jgi:hypothetical protein
MTPEQCKTARIRAKIDGDALAGAAGVDLRAIRAFETGIMRSNAEFAARLGSQLGRWESECGVVADDDVP